MTRAKLRVCAVPGCPSMQAAPRCPAHRRERDAHQRATVPTKTTRTHTERLRRTAVVDTWRTQHGNWCPGYGVSPHRADRLTADHITPISRGGAPDGPLAVLCISCNARKGART